MDFVFVEGGDLIFGEDKSKTSIPVDSFYMAQHPVTQAVYATFMEGGNPAHFRGDNRPVEQVNWDDTHEFIKAIHSNNQIQRCLKEQKLKVEWRLPSEAEWEYAAKGGKYTQGYEYSGSDDLNQVGWFRENSGRETKSVGLLLPNELGLYDMSGNVWEWCEDDYHDFGDEGRPKSGKAWGYEEIKENRATSRVLRGGGWVNYSIDCRPSHRSFNSPGRRSLIIGFRLCVQSVGD